MPDRSAQRCFESNKGTKQRIRFASEGEELRYWKQHPGASFTCLVAVVTRDSDGFSFRFWPFTVPRARLPDLPTDPETIRNIDQGRGIIMRRPGGYALRGYATEWSRPA